MDSPTPPENAGHDTLTDKETVESRDPGTDTRIVAKTELGNVPPELGPYRILKKLGEGGMGAVFLAEDSEHNRQVALKTPAFSRKDDEQIIKRFHREASAAATVQHPNICPVFDVGEQDGLHYMAMAYIDGLDLAHWLQKEDELSSEQALRIVQKIAQGLHAAHQAGLVHRDLKPANIMMVGQSEPMIMDFGMVRRLDVDETVLTPTGTMVGTPAYMSPEQILGERALIGPATDIYSLGVIMYEMLTGWPPFSGSLATMLGTIVSDPPPSLRSHCGELSPELDALCLKALAKTPEERFASAAELSDAIEQYLVHGRVDGAGEVNPSQQEGCHAAGTPKPNVMRRMWNAITGRGSSDR